MTSPELSGSIEVQPQVFTTWPKYTYVDLRTAVGRRRYGKPDAHGVGAYFHRAV